MDMSLCDPRPQQLVYDRLRRRRVGYEEIKTSQIGSPSIKHSSNGTMLFIVRLPQALRGGRRPTLAEVSVQFARGTAVQMSASWHERKALPSRTWSDARSRSLSALDRPHPAEVTRMGHSIRREAVIRRIAAV
jgi:hypothetical protein